MIRFLIPIMLIALAAGLAVLWPGQAVAMSILGVTVILIGIALWDLIQTKHSLRRNYPLIARTRLSIPKSDGSFVLRYYRGHATRCVFADPSASSA